MKDSLHMSGTKKNVEVPSITSKRTSKLCTIAADHKKSSQKALWHLVTLKNGGLQGGLFEQIAFFVVKVAALEVVRRVSIARCPFIWQGLKALQLLCYPPFKWIQRWPPVGNLVRGMQKLSRPLLLLSVATVFSDQSNCLKKKTRSVDEPQRPESRDEQSTSDTRVSTECLENAASESWLLELHRELRKQGIIIPERITEDDIRRFYTAANGDFSCLVSSVKKTIRWRETYTILSTQELEMWSEFVFFHGYDVKLRPCLIVRLGLACTTLVSHDRPRFAQAIVSQIEHGVLHLVNLEDPRITVVMDCEGLSAIRFPMQMMRCVSSLLQDNYPNRLGILLVIRLPPVARVIGQTLFQVLRPSTRQKLRVIGEMYHRVLTEQLQAVPSFLGGDCNCPRCVLLNGSHPPCQIRETSKNESQVASPKNTSQVTSPNEELLGEDHSLTDLHAMGNYDQVLRTAILGILMLWIVIALIVCMSDPENFSLLGS